ncbi:MAG: Uma2 family endonuclease [Armatimonadetes bacterium]|nr:Uma2 family endonuclease [Armatimonadota bacterium]
MAVQLKPQPVVSEDKPLPATPVTYEGFLDWADEDTYAEWVDGEIEIMSPASLPHQDLSGFLHRLLAQYAEDRSAGKVLAAPFQMKLAKVRRGREPDLLFITSANLARLRHNFLDGPADLAVEIVSPESALRDRGAKYGEYEAGGVREYWILDSETQRADFFVLDPAGRYQRAQPDSGGIYRSAILPSLWINVGWLWQDPLPPVRQILREWEQTQP